MKPQLDYELLDYGEGLKLERFGNIRLIRPEPAVQNKPKTPLPNWQADSICQYIGRNQYAWEPVLNPWLIHYGNLELELRLSQSKNVGIFPEQKSNWAWLAGLVKPDSKILNLFAYTGVASLVCAQKRAKVCHVDASKAAVSWAHNNAKRNNIQGIRWIVDDVKAFLRREIARQQKYDGIILDPPPFGRAQTSDFKFERDILELLDSCCQVLKSRPDFFLLNSYAVNLKDIELKSLLEKRFKSQKIETGTLCTGPIALSIYARF